MNVERQLEHLLAGQPRALARLISAVENSASEAGLILAAVQPHLGHARVIGVTGPPGVGKSTLVGALVGAFRERNHTVGVIAVDPSSPVSGGAVLGDRIRMRAHLADPGVFIRSVSARGGGGLSAATAGIVDLMDAAGRDVIVIETVGAGQSEIEIAELADCTVVVLAPGLGDEVQAIKSGILEIADVLVVNKADLPHADRAREELRSMLALRRPEDASVPVLGTIADQSNGVTELADAIETHWSRDAASRRGVAAHDRMRRLLARAGAEYIHAMILAASSEYIEPLTRAIRSDHASLDAAARRLIEDLLGARPSSRGASGVPGSFEAREAAKVAG